ncbi:MAG: DUF2813 domain-containing protein [Bacteroidetes bacterium]|nr:DUF2813 domain-containing protein [Bacteroidota bacterium]
MKIKSLEIRNFRGVKNLKLDLDETTVLIGENNTGKTSIMDALRLCLSEINPQQELVFEPLDFHLPGHLSDPSSSDPIEITITFSEEFYGEWNEKVSEILEGLGIIVLDSESGKYICLRVTCQYDSSIRQFVQAITFLNQKGEIIDNISDRSYSTLAHQFEYYYLKALRDAGYHFDGTGPFWRPFLQDSQLSDDNKSAIESKLKEINDLIVSSHHRFDQVKTKLQELQKIVLVASQDVVDIEAVPNRTLDILSKSQVLIGTKTGSMIPLFRHGEGTQSLAVLMLFSAFLETQDQDATILALEEPEAHLHPSAVRILWRIVQTFAHQRIISTHSGELLSEVDIHHIRRLAQTPKGIQSFQLLRGQLTEEETRKFNYHIQRSRGELLFARCWLLVEGETEVWVYSAAATALGWNLHDIGVRIVEYQQSDVSMLAKVANALGISWYCVGDDDNNRLIVERKLKPLLKGSKEAEKMTFPYPNIETNLLQNGFGDVYEVFMSNHDRITTSINDPDYWEDYAKHFPKRSKVKAAFNVGLELETRGMESVSPQIRSVLDTVRSMSDGSDHD